MFDHEIESEPGPELEDSETRSRHYSGYVALPNLPQFVGSVQARVS